MSVPLIVVDAANVVGSVPDGWWRDRAGAAIRLRDRLVAVATTGLVDLPGPVDVVMVVEGRARDIPAVPAVRVHRASGSGDDAVVAVVAAEGPGRRCVVVTSDRQLRQRVAAHGAQVRGPRSLPG